MTEYKNPPMTVDAIIEENDCILLIRRKSDTFYGYLALPGGFVDYGESVEQAVKRELMEELHLNVKPIAILGVYSDSERDPRGHVISTVFICNFFGLPDAGDDASSYEWVSLNKIAKITLAFDHNKIVEDYKLWVENKGTFWSSKN